VRILSSCRCLLCQLEIHLKQQLGDARSDAEFAKVAASGFLLSGFPNALALTAHLRSCRSNGNGIHPADTILGELLHLHRTNGRGTLLRDILLLAFIPVLHTALRQVTQRYRLLPAEDAAQQLVMALVEALDSRKLVNRDSHLAFAISRMAKRNAFEWAERQIRVPGNSNRDEPLCGTFDTSGIPQPLERAVLLHHFLSRCQREGLLTGTDIELLVHIKLEGHVGEHDREYSNALRQRIKRLLAKLRKVARTKPSFEQDQESSDLHDG
jgi:hypothetical protein